MFDDAEKIDRTEESVAPQFLAVQDLDGQTVVVELKDYDAQHQTKGGRLTDRAVVDVFVASGSHVGTIQTDTWWFGNVAKQLGASLGIGKTGVGVIKSGVARSGNNFVGIDLLPNGDERHKKALKDAVAAVKGSSPQTETKSKDEVPF